MNLHIPDLIGLCSSQSEMTIPRTSERASPQGVRLVMLFMIVERFRGGTPDAVGTRFKAKGRMIPPGSGVEYVASWMAGDGASCYQLMNAPEASSLDPWIAAWADLAEFEVIPVKTSAKFWAARSQG